MSVYFAMEPGDCLVKIGWSRVPALRRKGLRCAYKKRVEMIRVIDGGRNQEKWLHNHFASLRVSGEWFLYSPEMKTIVPPYDEPHGPVPSLLHLVNAFLMETGMSEGAFGYLCMKDPNFVSDLRKGRRVWPETRARVMGYIVSGPMTEPAP